MWPPLVISWSNIHWITIGSTITCSWPDLWTNLGNDWGGLQEVCQPPCAQAGHTYHWMYRLIGTAQSQKEVGFACDSQKYIYMDSIDVKIETNIGIYLCTSVFTNPETTIIPSASPTLYPMTNWQPLPDEQRVVFQVFHGRPSHDQTTHVSSSTTAICGETGCVLLIWIHH